MTTTLQERISAHFRRDELRRIDVVEWGQAEGDNGDVTPFTIWHRPISIDDLSRMNRAVGTASTQFDRTLWLVLNKSCDAEGGPLFNADRRTDEGKADYEVLANKADPYVVNRIGLQMLANAASVAEA